VTLFQSKRQYLDNIDATCRKILQPSLALEMTKADKREGGLIRRFETSSGEYAQRLAELKSARVASLGFLEKEIDLMNEVLPELKSFILPGGHPVVSYCHIARCVCRRAERHTIRLAQTQTVEEKVIQYLNRLSDFLFVLARRLGKELGATETTWKARNNYRDNARRLHLQA